MSFVDSISALYSALVIAVIFFYWPRYNCILSVIVVRIWEKIYRVITAPHCIASSKAQQKPGVNTLRPRQNGRHFADDIFKCIFLNENVWIPIKISLKFVPKGPINSIPALVQIMAWCRPGDKPLSESMMVSLPTHICVTRPQWVNDNVQFIFGK